eukprot:GEMP01073514.1.p1 GENE.GEMP01073514.1~~GEMP01073514.1.p1  ORF type:complete len:349 (+),score=66.93 GEMP01073514.1:90-1136(+)
MDHDLEGYRQAQAGNWESQHSQNRGESFELEGLLNRFTDGADFQHSSKVIGISFCLMVFFLVSSLCSIGSLMPTEYGVGYNSVTKSIGSKTYHGGRHWIWPWNSFITFPATVVTVEFSDDKHAQQGPLETRTKDGLALELSLSFQYHVQKDSVAKLYALANLLYEPLFIRNARDVLMKAGADYEAFEYWQERDRIGAEMQDLVARRLVHSFANCTGLQLLVIHLPPEYESSIVDTQVEQQRVETRFKEQQSARIEAETRVKEATFSRNITILQKGANAEFFRIDKEARAVADQRRLEVEGETLMQVQQMLDLTADQLLTYQTYFVYSTLQNASMLYGISNVLPILNSS